MGALELNGNVGSDARTFYSLSPPVVLPGMLRRRALRAMSHSVLSRPDSACGHG
jgi:hypothetical protein